MWQIQTEVPCPQYCKLYKQTKHWMLYFQIAPKVLKIVFMTKPLNIVFGDVGIWLLGYGIEFSCLYIPQGHYFMSTLWLWSTDDYCQFSVFSESRSLNNIKKDTQNHNIITRCTITDLYGLVWRVDVIRVIHVSITITYTESLFQVVCSCILCDEGFLWVFLYFFINVFSSLFIKYD